MNGYNNILEKINYQWKESQDYFMDNNFEYKSYESLKVLPFYYWLFQIIDNAGELLTIENLETKILYRAVDEKTCKYDRFIPKEKFASDNRMNGKDKLYYYFGVGYEYSKTRAIKTCLKEIRVNNEDVSICQFELKGNSKEFKIIDFTIDEKIPTDKYGLGKYMKNHFINRSRVGISHAAAKTIINLLGNSNAFEPVNKEKITGDELKYKYVPFWGITDYLEKKGYDGMIYSSTVYKGGKNLVLFKLEKARYIKDTIEIFNSDDYFDNE